MILHLYSAFVRLYLEYCVLFGKDIDALQQVQWSASKTVGGLGNVTYRERLRETGFPLFKYEKAA